MHYFLTVCRSFARAVGWKLGAAAVGVLLLAVSKAFAQTIECAASCTVTVIHDLSLPPLQLSVDEAGQLAVAIIGVWASAWAIRMFIRTLKSDESTSSTDSN